MGVERNIGAISVLHLYGIRAISSRTIAVNRAISSVKSCEIWCDIAYDTWRKIVLYRSCDIFTERRRLYEIVRYRELKVRCRAISVTVPGTISRVKSYDIFRKSYGICTISSRKIAVHRP